MRVLAGYSPGLGSLLDGSSKPTTKHEVLSYGTNPCAGVQWDPACSSYQELMSLLPAGWTPDVAIFGSIEYVPVPQGIEFAECLTVGIVGDWNLGAQAYHLMGGAFDALIACFDAKFAYWYIRPSQADPPNAETGSPGITLAIPLPNHPSYPSGHSCITSAMMTSLSDAFPSERERLDALITITGLSRMYGGLHYRFDVEAGQVIGRGAAALARAGSLE